MHETTVHRWDIESALDCTTPIDRIVAVGGIDEYLDVFVRTRGKQTLTAPLTFATTRPTRAWTLTPTERPRRLDVAAGRSSNASAEVSGRPEALLLALWRRITLAESGLAVRGDPRAAASFFEAR